MTLASSGTMSTGGTTANRSINLELGLSATATSGLGQANFRTLAGVATGAISMSNFYGKSNIIPKGYVAGGASNTINVSLNTIYSLLFSTETSGVVSATLNQVLNWQCSIISSSKGYICGGRVTGIPYPGYFRINSMLLTTEAIALVTASMTNNNANAGNMSNQVTYGYCMTGYDHYPSNYALDGYNRLTYSTEAISSVATLLWGTWGSECASSTTDGYTPGYGGTIYVWGRFTYSTETAVNAATAFASNASERAAGNSTTVAYWSGGNGGAGGTTPQSFTHAITFATNAIKTVSATLPAARAIACAPNSSTKMYVAGGVNSALSNVTTIYPLTFSTETYATLSAVINPSHSAASVSFQSGGTL